MGAGDPARARRREHQDRIRDLLGTAEPSRGHLMRDEVLLECWILAEAALPVAPGSQYRAGRDRVDADIFVREFAREHFGERMQRGFRRVVSQRAAGLASVDRADIYDRTAAAFFHVRSA